MKRHEMAGVVYYTFESFEGYGDMIHGITTRRGGVSTGHWASLNLTKGNGDDPAAVEENLRRASCALGVRREDLVSPNQRHTTRAQWVGRAERGKVIPETDSLLTNETDVPILLRFADCTPILLYDPLRRALAVVHSGWRGTVAGAIPAAVHALREAFGSRPGDLVAGIGPSIGPCCYEVGDEVVAAVRGTFDRAEALLPRNGGDRRRFDLWAANRRWLAEAGIPKVEEAEMCTACHMDEFFSYRGGSGHTGHFGALMMLRARHG
jgi:YfiH family protein